MIFRSLIAALALLASAEAADAPPSDFASTYVKLSAFLDQEELDPLEVAAGSLWAARFYSVGRPGLEPTRRWFRSAATCGRASAAGLYQVVHGSSNDLMAVRVELETSKLKRGWLHGMVGTEPRFEASLENGKSWASLSRVLPATAGCRTLAIMCIRSRDPLVRRAGVFWGYWFADAPYWGHVRRLAAGDGDAVTRKVSANLLRREPRTAK